LEPSLIWVYCAYIPLEPSGGASGQATDISIHAKEILRIRESLTNMYADHCMVEGEARKDARDRFGELCILCSYQPPGTVYRYDPLTD
jgi:hypothetical protein